MNRKGKKWPLLAALSFVLVNTAQADIYGFVDEQGIPHYSNIPQDRRYKLFLRTAREPVPAPAAQPRAASGKSAKISSLIRSRRQAFSAHVASLASALGMEAALLHAVITAESGYNPKARSDKGAMGLMQLMPDTARRYCVDDPFDPVQNLRGGSQYLRDLLERYNNDPKLALAAYNAGEGAVARHGNQVPPYRETQLYVPLVMKFYEHYRKLPGMGPIATSAGDRSEPAARNLGVRCG